MWKTTCPRVDGPVNRKEGRGISHKRLSEHVDKAEKTRGSLSFSHTLRRDKGATTTVTRVGES